MLSLPLIDLRKFPSPQSLSSELMRVGKDPGFFYVTGHDLTDDAVAPIFDLAQSFFQTTALAEKLTFRDGSGDLGYTGMRDESLGQSGPGDIKESFYLCDPGTGVQKLPTTLEQQREKLSHFFAGSRKLADVLLRAMAIGLGVTEDLLVNAHTGESCRMRLLNYPNISPTEGSADANDIRAGEHTDYGSLTLLFRQPSDQGGLQVLMPENNSPQGAQWIDVPCIPNAVVVNIGDALEFWTAGRLRSTMHRVAFPRTAEENVSRLSIPVFIQPDRSVMLAPIQTSLDVENVDEVFQEVLRRKGYASAAPVTSHEHLQQRIRSTYATAR